MRPLKKTITATLFLLCFTTLMNAQKKYEIKINPVLGKVYTTSSNIDMDYTIKTNGNEMKITSKQNFEIENTYAKSGSNFALQSVFQKLETSVLMPGMEKKISSEDPENADNKIFKMMKGKAIKMVYTPDLNMVGEPDLSELEKLTGTIPADQMAMLKTMAKGMQSLKGYYPSKPVAEGESWPLKLNMDLGTGINMEMNGNGKLIKVNPDSYEVQYDINMNSSAQGIVMEGKGVQTISFDRKTGLPSYYKFSMPLQGKGNIQGNAIEMTMNLIQSGSTK
ncbi:DUF6263 family protein [Porphyromonas pogonae]|uniref:DUF6263 family protein n=1 Tax=Porphyromonas pogonae TaxID=867595 RepID=UPI002E75A075|nr:DUF6263 family protein [Porphyromonas pogonae]